MNRTIVLRGGGDIASGVAHRLVKCGFEVVILEIPNPTVIRRTVSFASAVFKSSVKVEDVTAKLVRSLDEARELLLHKQIPVIIDPHGDYILKITPFALVDCILAKKNLGTKLEMASIVIGVGPGFTAGEDVHAVVESKRGHDLGRVIYKGKACDDTGMPGDIAGYTYERIIRACDEGAVHNLKQIGDMVSKGEVICTIEDKMVHAQINGVLRGLIQDKSIVYKGMKIGDIDPRGERDYCFTISDKARAIGGGVLEAIMSLCCKGM